MSEVPLQDLVSDWRLQSRDILKKYFKAKQDNDDTEMEIIANAMDKIAQQFITFLKEDLKKGTFKTQLDKISAYFEESGDFSFKQIFDFETKVISSVEQAIRNQTKSGIVNQEINNKLRKIVSSLLGKEVNFNNLLKSLVADFNYISHIIDSISESNNLVKWLKHVSVKASKSRLTTKEYKDLNKVVDSLFGKLPLQGVKFAKKERDKKELLSNKIIGFLDDSEKLETDKKSLLQKLSYFISKLNNLQIQNLTVHDTRPLFDFNNKIRFITEKQNEILVHIKSIYDNCKKLADYSKNLSISYLVNVDIIFETDTYTDLLEIKGKIQRQTSK